MNSPVTTSPVPSAANSRDAAPAGQAARQRGDGGGDGSGADTKFSDLLPARHPASTAPADKTDKSGTRAHEPKRRQAAHTQDDDSAALLAAAQAGAANQPARPTAADATAPASAADAGAASGLAKAKGHATAARTDAGGSAAPEPGGDAQGLGAGPAFLARLIHDQLETARPARPQTQAADEPGAARARAHAAAQRTGPQGGDAAAPDVSADAAGQIARGASGAPHASPAAHGGHVAERHAPQPSLPGKPGKTASIADVGNATNATTAANAANTTNAINAAAARQAPPAGTDVPAMPPDQAAALVPAQTPPAAASAGASGSGAAARIGTPLGHPRWAEDFSQQMLVLSSGDLRNQSVKLHITPPELGPLHIALNISDNVAHAVFASAHAEVRNAIENALPQLQQALAQNGLALGQANVGEQRQFAQEFREPAGQNKRGAGFELGVAAPGAAAAAGPAPRRASGNSLVDTFA